MAEPYFQFKKFRVYHNSCGLKVGTDGVLLGAWAPVKDQDRVLDIGTGSGLIALMLAQRACISIDALEIDAASAMQARENVERSMFSNMHVYHEDVSKWANKEIKYDFIVCNPPFFTNASSPKNTSTKLAKHTVALTPVNLFKYVKMMLVEDGRFSIIFPKTEYDMFWGAAEQYGFFPKEILKIHPDPASAEIRLLVNFVLEDEGSPKQDFFSIEKSKDRHDYSDRYKELTKDFFLRF